MATDAAGHRITSIAPRAGKGISRAVIVLLAVVVGATVANRYYVQPLLNLITRDFGVSDTTAGLLVTWAQIGYMIGLVSLVPLGDLFDRRRLVTGMLVGAGAAAAGCAAAPSLPVLAAGLVALGLLSVAAQILIPFAATLAAPDQRGRVVGIVSSGLMIGVLLARTVAGLVAGLGGFRLIFAIAAGVMITLALWLWRVLPTVAPYERRTYRSLLHSVVALIVIEPVLRQRMLLGCLQMAGFSVLWTPIAFLLAGAPYRYSTAVIGLFGLVGIAGALTAPLAGRLVDLGHSEMTLTVFSSAILASWALLALGRTSLIALIAGIALLDFGVQGAQVNNQTAIFALQPQARSRINTAYMVAFTFGGALGSLLAATVYGAAGWAATCALGGVLAAAALVLWITTEPHVRRRRADHGESNDADCPGTRSP